MWNILSGNILYVLFGAVVQKRLFFLILWREVTPDSPAVGIRLRNTAVENFYRQTECERRMFLWADEK